MKMIRAKKRFLGQSGSTLCAIQEAAATNLDASEGLARQARSKTAEAAELRSVAARPGAGVERLRAELAELRGEDQADRNVIADAEETIERRRRSVREREEDLARACQFDRKLADSVARTLGEIAGDGKMTPERALALVEKFEGSLAPAIADVLEVQRKLTGSRAVLEEHGQRMRTRIAEARERIADRGHRVRDLESRLAAAEQEAAERREELLGRADAAEAQASDLVETRRRFNERHPRGRVVLR